MAGSANPVNLFFTCIALLIGLICTTIGAATGWSSWSSLSTARRTEGTVVELETVKPLQGVGRKGQIRSKNPTFAPVVEYHVDGQTYRIRGHFSSNFPPKQGETVSVVYPPDRPSEGMIDSFWEQWLGPLLFGGLGLIFTLVGLGMLIYQLLPRKASVEQR
jgi:hypothetical protein